MRYFNLSAQLNDNELGEIKACLHKINSQTRRCVTLSPKQRRRMFKMGDKSVAFVKNSLTAARNHSEALPVCFDVDAFEHVVHRAAALRELRLEVNKLARALDDTAMAVSAEALQQSGVVYEFIKIAAVNVPGLRAVAEQLGTRFARPSRKGKAGALVVEPARVTVEVQTINHEPVTIPIQAEPVADGVESLNDARGHLNDAARSVNGECERLSDAPGHLNDAARSVDRECARLSDESVSLNDEAPHLNREFRALGDESFRCTGESSELNDECASLDEATGRCSDECRRDNDEPRTLDHEPRRRSHGPRSRCGNESMGELRRRAALTPLPGQNGSVRRVMAGASRLSNDEPEKRSSRKDARTQRREARDFALGIQPEQFQPNGGHSSEQNRPVPFAPLRLLRLCVESQLPDLGSFASNSLAPTGKIDGQADHSPEENRETRETRENGIQAFAPFALFAVPLGF